MKTGPPYWRGEAVVRGIYRLGKNCPERVGNCWAKGRLREGDLLLCEEHSGDCFYNYWLIDAPATNVNGDRVCTLIPEKIGAYTLGQMVTRLSSRDFHLLLAGDTTVAVKIPEPGEKDMSVTGSTGKSPAINIILDEGSHHKPQVLFIEIELDNGEGVRIGEHSDYQGLTKLRITAADIMRAQPDKKRL